MEKGSNVEAADSKGQGKGLNDRDDTMREEGTGKKQTYNKPLRRYKWETTRTSRGGQSKKKERRRT